MTNAMYSQKDLIVGSGQSREWHNRQHRAFAHNGKAGCAYAHFSEIGIMGNHPAMGDCGLLRFLALGLTKHCWPGHDWLADNCSVLAKNPKARLDGNNGTPHDWDSGTFCWNNGTAKARLSHNFIDGLALRLLEKPLIHQLQSIEDSGKVAEIIGKWNYFYSPIKPLARRSASGSTETTGKAVLPKSEI